MKFITLSLLQIITLSVLVVQPLNACERSEELQREVVQQEVINASISNFREEIPLLINREECLLLQFDLDFKNYSNYKVETIKINFSGTTDPKDLESAKLIYVGDSQTSSVNRQFGKIEHGASILEFTDNLLLSNPTASFRLMVKLKSNTNLLHRINAFCESVSTDVGTLVCNDPNLGLGLRVGIALRQHGDDNVDTYRIPGLATTKNGTLLGIYDVRRDKSRDLQGDIDIGVSRSTDGGNTWEPMHIALDRGTWGNLPEKFNGISDACILVDDNTNTIFVAGLWMYGVLDEDGKWIEGLTENSSDWNHQWRDKGSQPGFDEKQTSQFLITKSTDDGLTWSEPENLTRMCKQEDWWLWAPAPGHGITLKDGTLVFPTQGRNKNGTPFSNITWSRDGGKTWKTSNPASSETTENMIVELNDGSVMLNARDNKNRGNISVENGRNIHVTNDLGETWTTHPTSHNALIEPTCMASIHRHFFPENGETKSILIFSNPNSKTSRDHMTIKVSLDDGMTWPEKYWILLDAGKGRGYSCLTSIDEQTIGILYEGSQADMVFQKISLSELLD
ncbi:sialidase family protein [Maribellus sediminis]|uniref:sialidase family protein n=1 Tax=Maribellus sediminis TaxID=2696285 RepID=UPI0023F6FAE4|nr:sialidase family protein [Maribellus sediminis]